MDCSKWYVKEEQKEEHDEEIEDFENPGILSDWMTRKKDPLSR